MNIISDKGFTEVLLTNSIKLRFTTPAVRIQPEEFIVCEGKYICT